MKILWVVGTLSALVLNRLICVSLGLIGSESDKTLSYSWGSVAWIFPKGFSSVGQCTKWVHVHGRLVRTDILSNLPSNIAKQAYQPLKKIKHDKLK